MNHKLLLILSLSLLSLTVWGQSKITMRESWMYTDVSLKNGGAYHRVSGMIDTGCSVCIIDSTFAIDSCHITDTKGDRVMDNTAGKSIKSSYVYLDSITFAQTTYTHVWCFIVDLAGKLKQFAPKFIIGGDILKRAPWCFDLMDFNLQRLTNIPVHVSTSIVWKNYADAGLNIIYLKGKIAGKKTLIHFDTGARFNAVLPTSELTPTAYIEIPGSDIAEALTTKTVGQCKDIPVEISDYCFKVDFIKPTDDGSEEPRLNASFLMGKKWVLDYEHRQLLILPE